MSRKIKFRMWDAENSVMINGDSLAFEEYAPITTLLSQEGIMQYTGLQDKNGKPIYEGDILFVDNNYDRFGWAAAMRGEVIFDKGKFMLTDNSGTRFFFEDNEMDYVEIVGNIYETPDLLKS